MSIPNGHTSSGRILSIPVTLEASVLKYGGSVRGVECQFSSLRCRSGGCGAGQRSSGGTTRPGPRALPAAHQATPQVESSQRSGRVPNASVPAAQVQVMVRALRFYAWPVTSQHPTPTGEKWVGIPGVDPRRYSIGQPGNLKHLRPTTALSQTVAAKLQSGHYVTIRDCSGVHSASQ